MNLDLIGTESHPGNNKPSEDITVRMKDKLALRSLQAARMAKRSMQMTIALLGSIVILAMLGGAGWSAYKSYTGKNFYSKSMTDERSCSVRVGGVEMTGRRYYTYRYEDILGVRLINKDDIVERTDLNVTAAGYTIISYQKDFTPKVTVVPKGEVGIQKLDPAETYVIFSEGKVGTASYTELCRDLNPRHPFATTE